MNNQDIKHAMDRVINIANNVKKTDWKYSERMYWANQIRVVATHVCEGTYKASEVRARDRAAFNQRQKENLEKRG